MRARRAMAFRAIREDTSDAAVAVLEAVPPGDVAIEPVGAGHGDAGAGEASVTAPELPRTTRPRTGKARPRRAKLRPFRKPPPRQPPPRSPHRSPTRKSPRNPPLPRPSAPIRRRRNCPPSTAQKACGSISTTAAAWCCRRVRSRGASRIRDLDTGNILFETEIKAGRINSAKRYFVRFRHRSLAARRAACCATIIRPRDREVLIQFPVGTLGDTLGWFPYAVKFKERHGCKLTCAMAEKLIPLFARRLSGHHLHPPRGGQAGALLRHLQHRAVLRRQGFHLPAVRFPPCRAAPHRRLYPRRRSRPKRRRASRSPTIARPIAEPYVCIARAEHDAEQILEQSRRLARDRRVPESSRLPRHLHRPEAGPRPGPGLEPHPATAPRTRPATGRCRSARAGSSTRSSSSACPAACPGSPGRRARRW